MGQTILRGKILYLTIRVCQRCKQSVHCDLCVLVLNFVRRLYHEHYLNYRNIPIYKMLYDEIITHIPKGSTISLFCVLKRINSTIVISSLIFMRSVHIGIPMQLNAIIWTGKHILTKIYGVICCDKVTGVYKLYTHTLQWTRCHQN